VDEIESGGIRTKKKKDGTNSTGNQFTENLREWKENGTDERRETRDRATETRDRK